MPRQGLLHIGTCGWSYKHWVGPFYPSGSKAAALLGHYSARFSAVEIDNSFYRLPAAKTLARWRAETPQGFAFTCKANRYITHMKKLKEPARTLAPFLDGLAPLGDKLKVVVFQLPPRWRCNLERLEAFLDALPPRPRFAFEFRDQSWLDPAVYAALARHGAAFCICDLGGRQSPYQVTADFVYLRLHGPALPYQGAYSPQRLTGLARRIGKWRAAGRDCFVFFDNDAEGQAPLDALRLRAQLEKR